MPERHFLFLLASGRVNGNSEQLARLAAEGLPAGTAVRWLRLQDHPLPLFADTRHDDGYGDPHGTALLLAEATLEATDLVIVSPVYWYSLPAPAKLYLDHWSAWMRAPSLAFRSRMAGKRLWAILSDSDQEGEGSADPVLDTLGRTATFMGLRFAGRLLGHGSKPGEALLEPGIADRARRLFHEVSDDV